MGFEVKNTLSIERTREGLVVRDLKNHKCSWIHFHFLSLSADYMQALAMKFTTKEDAIAFADKQGKTMHTLFVPGSRK